MSLAYWGALRLLNQVAGELGLPQYTSVVGVSNVQSVQLLALLQAAGNELNLYYPWEHLNKEWSITTVPATEIYTPPLDFKYATDQTQWDRSNRWPLLGPKSAQEWAWLKGSLVATLPRMRYRFIGGKMKLFPIPTTTINITMEYTSGFWVQTTGNAFTDTVVLDTDILLYDPWLLIKFIKLKFYELKGFSTLSAQADFMRVFNALTGKDAGASILSLAPVASSFYIGSHSVPDGSWNV